MLVHYTSICRHQLKYYTSCLSLPLNILSYGLRFIPTQQHNKMLTKNEILDKISYSFEEKYESIIQSWNPIPNQQIVFIDAT